MNKLEQNPHPVKSREVLLKARMRLAQIASESGRTNLYQWWVYDYHAKTNAEKKPIGDRVNAIVDRINDFSLPTIDRRLKKLSPTLPIFKSRFDEQPSNGNTEPTEQSPYTLYQEEAFGLFTLLTNQKFNNQLKKFDISLYQGRQTIKSAQRIKESLGHYVKSHPDVESALLFTFRMLNDFSEHKSDYFTSNSPDINRLLLSFVWIEPEQMQLLTARLERILAHSKTQKSTNHMKRNLKVVLP